MTGEEPEVLILPDQDAWRAWLDRNEGESDGVWLFLAKKGTTAPTSLSYAQAVEEALCSGWIDGQSKRIDDAVYRVRFTPRRKASLWSQRNVGIVGRLIDEGRMRQRGQAEVARAKADGRWQRAYAGPSTVEVPDDLAAALAASPGAQAAFDALGKQERYSVLHSVVTAPSDTSRARRIERAVDRLNAATSASLRDESGPPPVPQ
ncbi:YdeI/OmpD-associated family protein [Tessaracoccus sp. OS52]|uniref:YdeI/OmpD-associated family protein n=1 Tax=Tessaracoccus sp. OS52 TaxID=2886691 RepID=UPI001D125F3A|nr:YdeI/OmpD-associated family protein [Tessaracoccus sp. OS52]MCC2592723.1 YdeI/OmpD-associated family protein [Tessaracoccus sp. OS52]